MVMQLLHVIARPKVRSNREHHQANMLDCVDTLCLAMTRTPLSLVFFKNQCSICAAKSKGIG